MQFLRSKAALWLTVLVCLQGVAYYAIAARPERTPSIAPLATFPSEVPGWRMVRDYPIEPEVLDILKADDTLNRLYASDSRTATAFFFMAYFKTQRYGAAPHSPKNCLPGSGWEPVETPGTISIAIAGRQEPIVASRYVVERGDQRSVVIYWYQSHQRAIAGEFSAKFWLVADAIRYGRSDTALVKVVVPAIRGDFDSATQNAVDFIKAAYPRIAAQLPE